jgi:hypothetical protein
MLMESRYDPVRDDRESRGHTFAPRFTKLDFPFRGGSSLLMHQSWQLSRLESKTEGLTPTCVLKV